MKFVLETHAEGAYDVYPPELAGAHPQGESLEHRTENVREA